MKNQILQAGLVFAMGAGFWLSVHSQAADLQTNPSADQTNTVQLSQQFLASQQKWEAETAAQDEQLRQLVAQMNSVPPEQKLDAMAAIVSKLVDDRLASHQRSEALKSRLLQALTDMAGTGTNGLIQATNQPPLATPPPGTLPVPNPAPTLPPR